jgi:hypothetical protein
MREEPSRTTSTTTKPSKHYPWGTILLWVTPLLLLLLFLSYGLLTRLPAVPGDTAPRLGQPLPDFTLPDLQGNPVQLATLQGKVTRIKRRKLSINATLQEVAGHGKQECLGITS